MPPEVEQEPLAVDLDAVLLDESLPFGVDWAQPAAHLSETARIIRLAHLKAILPPNNAIDEGTTHDATLENYIRLALQASGDRDTLDLFLSTVGQCLEKHPDSAQTLAQQVFWIWGPAAEIAGLYDHKTTLEDQAFKVLLPDEYDAISQSYTKEYLEAAGGVLQRTEDHIATLVGQALADPETPFELETRAKSYYSVWRKLQEEGRSEVDIFDLLGFRITIDGEDETAIPNCYIALAAVASRFESEKTRLKDYISNPKSNGYQSLHLTLYTATGMPFELQVRTRDMDERARLDGRISHQGYDASDKEVPGKIKQSFRTVPRLYSWRDEAAHHIRQRDGATQDVLGDDILFFRADGNLYRIARDSSAMDASFRIHSLRALRTKTIENQGKPISFGSTITHGMVLDIAYRPTQPVHREYYDNLAQVVSTKSAKKAIERGWREVVRVDLREAGRAIIKSMISDPEVVAMLREREVQDPLMVLDDTDRRDLADRIGVSNFDALLEMVGVRNPNGKPTRVVNRILGRLGLGSVAEIKLDPEPRLIMSNTAILQSIIIPSTAEQPPCTVAGCCTERIQTGDPILVRPSRATGTFKLHREDCVNIRNHSDTISCSWRQD